MHAPLAPPPPLTTDILVRPVIAVLLAVTEELLVDAGQVPAGQLVHLLGPAHRLVRHQQGLGL